MKRDLTGERKKVSEAFEVKNHALLHIKRLGLYNCDLRQRDFLHASVLEVGTHFWMKEATRDVKRQMIDYTGTGDTEC